jgi:hypothetical protein
VRLHCLGQLGLPEDVRQLFDGQEVKSAENRPQQVGNAPETVVETVKFTKCKVRLHCWMQLGLPQQLSLPENV